MQTIAILQAEHDGVLAVLAQLERAAAAIERGVPVPFDVFRDIEEFFAVFVDRCHHGKEEAEIFSRLERIHDATLIQHLEADHGVGRKLAGAYARAVRLYVPGDIAAGAQLTEAALAYSAFLRAHIDRETQVLFPVIERALAAEDQALVEAFERIEVERIGAGTHERLHGMIDELPGRIAPYLAA